MRLRYKPIDINIIHIYAPYATVQKKKVIYFYKNLDTTMAQGKSSEATIVLRQGISMQKLETRWVNMLLVGVDLEIGMREERKWLNE